MINVPKFRNKDTKFLIHGRKYIEPLTNAAYSKTENVQVDGATVKIIDFGDRNSDEWECLVEVEHE